MNVFVIESGADSVIGVFSSIDGAVEYLRRGGYAPHDEAKAYVVGGCDFEWSSPDDDARSSMHVVQP